MNKLSYLIKRISKMSYKNLFETVNKVHTKYKKNRILIFMDIIFCGLKYQAGYIDYYQFQMYKMNRKERKTIITRGVNNYICKKYNDKNELDKFEDKSIFNELFKEYMNRDWLKLTEENLDDFKAFANKHKEFIVKPIGLSCGKGVEKINSEDKDMRDLYNILLKNQQILIEEIAEQHPVLNELYPNSINTLRVVTLNKKVVAAFLRIGNKGNIVDNFNHGGMVTKIEIDTGEIKYKAIDKETNEYEIHPITNKRIVGLKIPNWEDVKKLCIDACDVVPNVKYVAWDVCLGSNKPSLIEGNDFPGHDLYQLPVHRDNNTGLLPIFEKAMKED